MPSTTVQHVFVLMLENRAFDHMLGFSALSGTDASSGGPTTINGLRGDETNESNRRVGKVSEPADDIMAVDPGHEFEDVLCQLAGPNAVYTPRAQYPNIDNSGFMASYASVCARANQQRDAAEILKCFSSAQLPVLKMQLATPFVSSSALLI